MMPGACFAAGVGLSALLLVGWAPAHAQSPPPGATTSVAELTQRAFTAAYNLDHEEAMALARQAVTLNPDDPRGHRTVASILWLNILFRRGAVTVDYYMGSLSKSRDDLPAIPDTVREEFHAALTRSIELATARLELDDADVTARYQVGSAHAILASFNASVEGSARAAFGPARTAFNEQEKVLERVPDHAGAKLTVGTYRYVVSDLNFAARWFAYMAGFGGGKDRGIRMIEEASQDPTTWVDARSALLLIYTREKRFDDALRVAVELMGAYPKNRLFALEAGAAAVRAGQPARGERLISEGLEHFDNDERPKAYGERAVWHYKRGQARILVNRLREARTDLELALESEAAPWINGRIRLELGKLSDLEGQRAAAMVHYRQARTIARTSDDPDAEKEASRWLRRPFERDAGG